MTTIQKHTNIAHEKYQKILVVGVKGDLQPHRRYFSRYAKVLFLSSPSIYPAFTTIPRSIVKLTFAILSFRPNVILTFPYSPLGLSSAVIGRLFLISNVIFTYGNDIIKRTRLGKLAVFFTLRLSHGVICDYRGLARLVRRMGGRNVTTIPLGIDTSHMPPMLPRKVPNTIVCVINFNLAYEKGIDLLIQAIKELPDAHLILIGEGTQRSAMISLAKRLKVSQRVTFTGYIPHKEIWTHLMNATIFALPTRASILEGTNRAVLEAMLCGLPVVVTRTGGLPELIVDGVNGFVVEPENIRELARAISTLLNNPELRKKIGRNNKLKAKKYSVDILTARRYEYLSRFC